MIELPTQPAGVPWPTASWPRGELDHRAQRRLETLVDEAFASPELPGSLAEVVVHRGHLVLERYQGSAHLPGQPWGSDPVPVDAETPLLSWSMAKSLTADLIGLAIGEGWFALDDPAGFEAWRDDPRSAITVRHLLTMTDGLAWAEDYVDAGVSDVIEMLFGSGRSDVCGFATARPAASPPGTRWNYSSGTTNLLAGILARRLGPNATDAFARERVFAPIGMTTATLTHDDTGTFVGSSFVHATAQDYARFGLLHLRAGAWDARQVLPAGWVDIERAPVPICDDPDGYDYGAQWWLWPDRWGHPGVFSCQGYEGQRIVCDPATDTVIVRLGRTPVDHAPALRSHLRAILHHVADSTA